MAQQTNSQSRQSNSNSYPSPNNSYPSPNMSAYAYPAPTQGQGTEAYRASPTGSQVSLPSLNLPPIRSIDGRPPQQGQQQQVQQQQPQQQQAGQATMGSSMPLPMTGQYYPGSLPPTQHMNVTSDPNQPLRYPLPAPDGRIMSGGRHKKEIKRRTKTGCLTCRKRRIKCDEAHPTCRNCQKSKRDCLGYDPIFKAQPGPTAIQPAPSSAASMPGALGASSYPPPQGYMPAGAHAYAPTLSTGVDSPAATIEPYDYNAAIDPALEGVNTSQMQVPIGASSGSTFPGGTDQSSLPSFEAWTTYDGAGEHESRKAYLSPPVKPTKIEDLLALGGIHPPPLTPPASLEPSIYDEITNLYNSVYAPGIDKFLETQWFLKHGLKHVLADNPLCEQFAGLLKRISVPVPAGDFHTLAATQSLEATVVWAIMGLCRSAANAETADKSTFAYPEETSNATEVAKRLDIFEKLVSGQHLDLEPLPLLDEAARNSTVFKEQLIFREREFWRLIGKFLALRDDEASSAKEIDDTLNACRVILDSRENRDVIYSIAIARHVGQRLAEFPENLPHPTNNEEQDSKNKLWIAKKFIEDEAMGKGTSQVIQRLCGMATRSWTMSR